MNLHSLGINAIFNTWFLIWGCDCSALVKWEACCKREAVFSQKLCQGYQQVKYLSPATAFTLSKFPLKSTLSCNTFHWTSHSFSLTIWLSKGPALISFYSENPKRNERTGQRSVSLHQKCPFVSVPSFPTQSVGFISCNFSCPAYGQTGTVSAGI